MKQQTSWQQVSQLKLDNDVVLKAHSHQAIPSPSPLRWRVAHLMFWWEMWRAVWIAYQFCPLTLRWQWWSHSVWTGLKTLHLAEFCEKKRLLFYQDDHLITRIFCLRDNNLDENCVEFKTQGLKSWGESCVCLHIRTSAQYCTIILSLPPIERMSKLSSNAFNVVILVNIIW